MTHSGGTTMLQARAHRLAHRVARRVAKDDRGIAMMTSIMLMLIATALTVLVLGIVVSQVTPTQFARKNSRTVFAAEAGMNAALAQVRSAAGAPDFTGAVYGDRTKLPCTVNGPVTSSGATLTYNVSVQYFKENPTGRSAAWRATNAIPCTPGAGTTVQPTHAAITAEGLADGVTGMATDAGDRTIATVYQFQVTNSNVAGGLIYSFGDGYCLEADGTTVGSTITYVPKVDCGTDDVHQLWLYESDYKIKLASSLLGGVGQVPLCITGPPTSTSSTVTAKLQACIAAPDTARWNQLWSWEGGARWKGENPAITDYSTYCLFSGASSGVPGGRKLHIGTSCASDSAWGSFNPDPRVGAGAASASTKQIVNYLEFGRCFDVTDQQVGKAFMIVYPCKQDPSTGGTKLNWNHKWYYSEPAPGVASAGPQNIYVLENNSTSSKYCLMSPPAGANPAYVTLTSACSSTAANQKWTRYRDTGTYSTGYTFVDNLGRCIALGDKYNSAWSKIVVSSCTGGPEQKWNAPPDEVSASVGDYQELNN